MVEIDAEAGEIVKTWDFNLILDPDRAKFPANMRPDDWLHINSAVYDPSDDSILMTDSAKHETAESQIP